MAHSVDFPRFSVPVNVRIDVGKKISLPDGVRRMATFSLCGQSRMHCRLLLSLLFS
jgi:hypothetical protein